jgi:P2-related tail formation protein
MSKLLPTSLQQLAHIQAFDDLVAGRLDALPVEAVLVYIIDAVNAQALPYLAEQFDILGIKGYAYATTEEEKRAVVRGAIELHRYKGTPWAIKEALLKIGLVVNRIEEGVGIRTYYNGAVNFNGSRTYGSLGHWAYFRVYLNTALNTVISATQIADAVAIINEYKNVRSHLYDITVEVTNISDTLSPTDTLAIAVDALPEDDFGAYYNGLYTYNGSQTYANIADTVSTLTEEIDADAYAFIVATGVTDQTIQDATNELVLELKAQSLWSKMHVICPMVGGTAAAHKYNLKNPLDTNAAFRLSFVGSWTHGATGATPNGINAYANTFYTPSVNGALTSQHISYYSRSNAAGAYIEMGVNGSAIGTGEGQLYVAPNLSGTSYKAVNTTGNSGATGINAAAYFIASRTDATFFRMHRNGTQVFNDSGIPNTISNKNIYIGARNNNGTANAFSARECGFATIGEGLTAAETVTLNTIVQSFLTAIGR